MAVPMVSIVIPTFARPQLLARTLGTALAQLGVEIEVVVVHDGPDPGDALEPVRACGDARARWIELERHVGMAGTRNRGVEAARGGWLAFLDDDDLWAPWKLRGQLRVADERRAQLVYSSVVSVDDHLRPIAVSPAPDPEGVDTMLLTHNPIPAGASNVLTRRAVFESVGGFDESLVHLADWDAWIRLASEVPAAADADVTVAYVQHSRSMSLRSSKELRSDAERIRQRYRTEADAVGVQVDRAMREAWIADRARRAGRRGEAARIYAGMAWRHGDGVSAAKAVRAALGLPALRRRPPAPTWLLQHSAPAARVTPV